MNIKHLEVKRAYYADPENVVVQVCLDGEWHDRGGEPVWCDTLDYRIKPKTIRIGEIDVPEPVRVALSVGEEYWVVAASSTFGTSYSNHWTNSTFDRQTLSRGLIHLTREAAELHAKALILVSGGTTDGIDSGR